MSILVRATLAVLGLVIASSCAIAVDAKYYEREYGNMAKATRVDVAYEGKQLTFRAKTAATRSRVLVAASSEMAAKVSSGVLQNLAAGLIGRRLDP